MLKLCKGLSLGKPISIGGFNVSPSKNSLKLNIPLTGSITPLKGMQTTPTFNRDTTATVMDHEGIIHTALINEIRFPGARRVRNLCTYSENFSQWSLWAGGPTLVKNAGTIDGIAAYSLKRVDNNDDAVYVTLTLTPGSTYSISFKVKNIDAVKSKFLVNDVTNASYRSFYLNWDSETLSITQSTTYSFKAEEIATGEYIVSILYTAATGSSSHRIFIYPEISGLVAGMLATAVQIERVTGTQAGASEYVSVGELSWPYHGSGVDGVKCFTVDRDGASLDVNGALIEPSATNLLSYSTAYETLFSNGTAAYTIDTNASPDGGYNGRVYTFSSEAQTNYAIVSVTAGSVYCFSQWVALGTAGNAGYAIYDNTNSAWIVSAAQYSDLTTILQRKKVTFSVPATCTSIRIYPVRYIDSSNIGTVRLFGAQLELYTLTSYIPTSGATVTKTADVLTYDVSDLITQGKGSVYIEALVFDYNTANSTWLYNLSSSTTDRLSLYVNTSGKLGVIMLYDGSIVASLTSIDAVSDTPHKVLITYKTNSISVYIDGELVLLDEDNTIPSMTLLQIGNYGSSYQSFSQFKNFKYFSEVIPSTKAIRMTA